MHVQHKFRSVLLLAGASAVLCGLAFLGFDAVAQSTAEEARYRSPGFAVVPHCAEGFSEFKGFSSITGRTGKFSPTTGERLAGPSAFVSAHLETFSGEAVPGLAPNPQRMFLFPTESGRIVVRFLDWAGAY